MRRTTRALATVSTLALLAPVPMAQASAPSPTQDPAQAEGRSWSNPYIGPRIETPPGLEAGREVLPRGDGWASLRRGTTGGAYAAPEDVYVASTWTELRAALGGPDAAEQDTPRIVYVDGQIDADEAPDGRLLTCEDYADPEYSLEAYTDAYAPEVWGTTEEPSGPLEEARQRSQRTQAEQVVQDVPANTTVVGVGDDASITGGSLHVQGVDNVIVRNLHLSDAYDCFPFWDPTDAGGTWNSEYDNLVVSDSRHVWVDHNTLDDGENPPSSLPTVLGAPFEVHDGLVDVVRAADLVTISYNQLRDHDKTMLIGNSDSRTTDRGRLRVSIHHNLFEGTGQRLPRVRFGQVHVYDNHYVVPDADFFTYAWGVGRESQILAQENAFTLPEGLPPASLVQVYGGTRLEATGTLVNGRSDAAAVDVVAAYNAANPDDEPDLVPDAGFEPLYRTRIDPAAAVPSVVRLNAGAGRL